MNINGDVKFVKGLVVNEAYILHELAHQQNCHSQNKNCASQHQRSFKFK